MCKQGRYQVIVYTYGAAFVKQGTWDEVVKWREDAINSGYGVSGVHEADNS